MLGAVLADTRVRHGPRTDGGCHGELLKPDIDRLATGMFGQDGTYPVGELFLKMA